MDRFERLSADVEIAAAERLVAQAIRALEGGGRDSVRLALLRLAVVQGAHLRARTHLASLGSKGDRDGG